MRLAFFFTLLCFSGSSWAQTSPSDAWTAFNRAGAPNSNQQCFTPRNVSMSGGDLVIFTQSEKSKCRSFDLPMATYDYTSGFVSMRRFNFLYGMVEFRAKFGGGANTGSWPAIWMQDASCQASDPTGTDDNCNGQEIDIAEILNGRFDQVNQQIHVDNYTRNDGCSASTIDVSENYHIYDLVWSPGSLVFKIDGKTTCTIVKHYVPNAPMYLKINTFVGSLGGPVEKKSLPWTTWVDYVKVTQGNDVVFYDDFDGKPTRESVPAVSLNQPSSYHSHHAFFASVFARWRIWISIASAAALTALAIKLRNGKQRRG
jgi:beta-glucanase (GH16 family)